MPFRESSATTRARALLKYSAYEGTADFKGKHFVRTRDERERD